MLKRICVFVLYTLFVIVISSVMTTAYFHIFVLSQTSSFEQKQLVMVSDQDVVNSPLKEDFTIVEIFSYGCHYCESGEKDLKELESRMPAGARFIRLHLSNRKMDGFASYSPIFATLKVMGIEDKFHQNVFREIINKNIDLTDRVNLERWLLNNGIDVTTYDKVRKSPQVKALLDYMTEVSGYYKINATPTFIVNKKWVVLQDRDYPEFGDNLLSLLQLDQPLEP